MIKIGQHYDIEYMIETDAELETVKTDLANLIKKHKKEVVKISLVGNEPTIWDNFLPLCEYLKTEFKCILKVDTDGSMGIIWWTKAARLLDHINITVDYKTAKPIRLRKLSDFLYDLSVFVTVNVLIDPREFEQCTKLVEKIMEGQKNYPIIARPILMAKYTEKEQAYLDDSIKQMPDEEWYNEVVGNLNIAFKNDAENS